MENEISRREFVASTVVAGLAATVFGPAALAATNQGTKGSLFDKKVVLVTGGTSGIGKAVTEAFARQGAKVVFCGRSKNKGESIANALTKEGLNATFVVADIQKESDVSKLVKKTVSLHGRLDVAVNNAGIEFGSETFTEDDMAKHLEVIQTNLVGTMFCLKHEVAQMLKQGGGSVISMGSMNSVRGSYEGPAYSASKHGVLGLTRSMARRYSGNQIRFNLVSPYLVDHRIGKEGPLSPAERAESLPKMPMGRLISFEDIIQTMFWLASDASSIVTGQNIILDGGAFA
jgi:NAD(P)-dependent dehydrogenase (short-subunit alcohol dehydrogenase family)